MENVYMGLLKPVVLGFALTTIGSTSAANERRDAGRRPRDDERRGRRISRRARVRLPNHQIMIAFLS